MQYLGFVSGSSSQLTQKIQQRILQAQPILESFGNAVTMRRRLFRRLFSLFRGPDLRERHGRCAGTTTPRASASTTASSSMRVALSCMQEHLDRMRLAPLPRISAMCEVTTYLLESSRVVVHGNLERSYHCFYAPWHGVFVFSACEGDAQRLARGAAQELAPRAPQSLPPADQRPRGAHCI